VHACCRDRMDQIVADLNGICRTGVSLFIHPGRAGVFHRRRETAMAT
jgi:hypothetical protein